MNSAITFRAGHGLGTILAWPCCSSPSRPLNTARQLACLRCSASMNNAAARWHPRADDSPVPLDVALSKLGSAALLVGWTIHLKATKNQLGTVEEVLRQGRKGGSVTLLKTRRQTVLEPYGFAGEEEHYVPLDPSFVHSMHLKQNVLLVQLPKGFLSLGRRSLYLAFLAQELPQYSQAVVTADVGRRETRLMPTRQQLLAAGRRDLIDMVLQCGGFSEVAVELGLKSKRKPTGYWDNPDHLDAEVRAFVAGQWVELEQPMLEARTSGPMGAEDAALKPGNEGSKYYYNLVSQRITRRLPGGAGLNDVARLAKLESPKDRVMPSRSMVLSVGRWDLHHAITALGGYREVGETLGRRPPSHRREALVSSLEDLRDELHAFVQQQRQQQQQQEEALQAKPSSPGADRADQQAAVQSGNASDAQHDMPTEADLLNAGRTDIVSAIHRFGGYSEVAELAGLRPHRRPKAYWKDIDNVVKEMLQFVEGSSYRQASTVRHPTVPSSEASEDEGRSGHEAAGSRSDSNSQSEATCQAFAASTTIEAFSREVVQVAHAASKGKKRMPTQRQLMQAGRQDLLYAVQMHGHQRLAKRCGLQPQTRGLHIRPLSYPPIRQCLEAGPCSLTKLWEQLQAQHRVNVNKSTLSNFLKRMVQEGRLQKPARGVYELAPLASSAALSTG